MQGTGGEGHGGDAPGVATDEQGEAGEPEGGSLAFRKGFIGFFCGFGKVVAEHIINGRRFKNTSARLGVTSEEFLETLGGEVSLQSFFWGHCSVSVGNIVPAKGSCMGCSKEFFIG